MVTSRLRRKPRRAPGVAAALAAMRRRPHRPTGLFSISQTLSGSVSASPRISAAGCTKTLFIE